MRSFKLRYRYNDASAPRPAPACPPPWDDPHEASQHRVRLKRETIGNVLAWLGMPSFLPLAIGWVMRCDAMQDSSESNNAYDSNQNCHGR